MKISTLLLRGSSPNRVWTHWLKGILAAMVMLLLPLSLTNAETVTLATGSKINGLQGSWGHTKNNPESKITFTQISSSTDTYTLTFKGSDWEKIDNGDGQAANELRFRIDVSSWDSQLVPQENKYKFDTSGKTNNALTYTDVNNQAYKDYYFSLNIDADNTYTITVVTTDGNRSVKVDWVKTVTTTYSYQLNGSNDWTELTNNSVRVTSSQLPIKLKQTENGTDKYFSSTTNAFSATTTSTNYSLIDEESNATSYSYTNAISTRQYLLTVTPGTDGGSLSLTQVSNGAKVYVKVNGSNTSIVPYIWAWNGTQNLSTAAKWPGDRMTKSTIGDGSWYEWQAPDNVSSFTFKINNGNSQGDGNQSADLKANGNVYYYYNGYTYALQTSNPDVNTKSGLVPSGTSDITTAPYVWAQFNNNWSGKQMTASNDNRVYTLEIADTDLPAGSNYFRLPTSNNGGGNNGTNGIASKSNGTVVSINRGVGEDATVNGSVGDDKGNFRFSNDVDRYNKYYLELVHTSDGWKVAITSDGTIKDHYEISYDNGDSWTWLSLNTNSDNTKSTNIYKSGDSDGFYIRQVTGSGTKFLTQNTGSEATQPSDITLSSSNTTYTTRNDFTTESNGNIVILANKFKIDGTDNGYGWKLTLNENSQTLKIDQNSVTGRWLVLKADNGNTKGYKMYPSRSRSGGAVSNQMFTRNLKADQIKKDLGLTNYSGTIQAWISDSEQGTNHISSNSNGNGYSEYQNITLNEKHSYTWYWDERSNNPTVTFASHYKYWHVVDNSGKNGASEAFSNQGDYYLIGNMETASHYVDIDPTKSNNVTKLTRYVYKDGVGTPSPTYSSDDDRADSIVYRAVVPRPVEGWGELYLAVTSGNPVNKWVTTDWNNTIRPQVQTYNYDNDNNGRSGVDATALEGGLFKSDGTEGSSSDEWATFDEKNRSQALNPLVSSHMAATSYIFSMNVTYHTYRIIFNDVAQDNNMYIVGPAVNGTAMGITGFVMGTGNGTSSEVGNENYSGKWMGTGIKLTYDNDQQCYQYIDPTTKQEKPIKLIPGQQFRFVVGKDFRNTWYGEDATVPVTIHKNNNVDQGIRYEYKLNGNYDADGQNDTQFLNYVSGLTSTENKIYTSSQNITFGLENRSQTYDNIIRLYTKHVGENSRTFYTIQYMLSFNKFDQAYDLTGATGGLQYYRIYSDYNAHKIPAGVRVFVVSNLEDTGYDKNTTQIGTATLEEITTLGYIPAHTGVILGCDGTMFYDDTSANKNANTNNDFSPSDQCVALDVYDEDPNATYSEKNYLHPAESRTKFEGDMYAFNYRNGHAGFYYPNVGLYTSNNSAYLAFNDPSGSTTNAKRFVGKLAFSFGDIIHDDTTTGITDIEAEEATKNEPYYSLSGMRLTSKPTTPGIYIHNGRKVVIK